MRFIKKIKENLKKKRELNEIHHKLSEHGYDFSRIINDKFVEKALKLETELNFDITKCKPKILIYNIQFLDNLFEILKQYRKFNLERLLELYAEDGIVSNSNSLLNITHFINVAKSKGKKVWEFWFRRYTTEEAYFVYYAIMNDLNVLDYVDLVESVRECDNLYQCNIVDVKKAAHLKVDPDILKNNDNMSTTIKIWEEPSCNDHLSNDDLKKLKLFSSEQLSEILLGLQSNINVKCYFDHKMPSHIMAKARLKLEDEYVKVVLSKCNGDVK